MADPPFETRLQARIRNVLDSQTGPHPVWADSPAAWRTSDRQRRGRWPIRLLAIAALLAISGGVLAQVGSPQPRTDDPSPAPVIPDILRGQFVAQLAGAPRTSVDYPFYFIDLEDTVLVHGPGASGDPVEIQARDGTAADWAGRIVRFTPAGAGSATVVIQAPLPCGEGRYLVRYDEAERPADPHPWALTFTEPQDPCADRLEILVGGSAWPMRLPTPAPAAVARPSSATPAARVWTHQPSLLVSGERYASSSFTEPFHFLMPAANPRVFLWDWLAPGELRFSNVYWRGELFDDWTLPIDHCNTGRGSLPDIPPSREAFESWLASNGRLIEDVVEIDVDGQTVMRYATSEPSCPDQEPNTFASRWYLIPTGDDTILFNVYGDTDTEYQVADEIVRSMVFD